MFLVSMELIGHIGLKLLVITGRGERLPRFCSYERLNFESCIGTECECWLQLHSVRIEVAESNGYPFG